MAILIYRIMEDLSGQNGGKKVLPYRIAQAVKSFVLKFIK